MQKATDPIARAALTDPATKFEHPLAIAAAAGLTVEAKLAALDRWAAEINQRLEASNEGMTPGPNAPCDLAIMDEIAKARRIIGQAT